MTGNEYRVRSTRRQVDLINHIAAVVYSDARSKRDSATRSQMSQDACEVEDELCWLQQAMAQSPGC